MSTTDICISAVKVNAAQLQTLFFGDEIFESIVVSNNKIFHWESKRSLCNCFANTYVSYDTHKEVYFFWGYPVHFISLKE